MEQIHKDRLNRLADFLDTLPPEKFDFRRWVGFAWEPGNETLCNTTGCAMGWAATMPEFKALGLGIYLDRDTGLGVSTTLEIYKEISAYEDNYENPSFSMASEAGLLIFGLNKEEFSYLFTPSDGEDNGFDDILTIMPVRPNAWAKAKEVADHIRQFIANS